jgi:hypothetical protein
MQQVGGGHGEDPRAGAEIKYPRAPLPGARLGCAPGPAYRFAEPIEREQAAIRTLTTIHQAETQYYSTFGRYAATLAELGPPARARNAERQ